MVISMKEKVICRKCRKKRVNIGFGYCRKCVNKMRGELSVEDRLRIVLEELCDSHKNGSYDLGIKDYFASCTCSPCGGSFMCDVYYFCLAVFIKMAKALIFIHFIRRSYTCIHLNNSQNLHGLQGSCFSVFLSQSPRSYL